MSSYSIPVLSSPTCASASARHAGRFGFLRRHLYGDYGLARTYWLHLVLGAKMYQGFPPLLLLLAQHMTIRTNAVLTILLIVAAYAWWTFLAIGTWASAGKHVARGGARRWAIAARTMIVLAVPSVMLNLPDSVTTVREHWDAATGVQPGPATVYYLSADRRSLTLYGGINDGTAATLEEHLSRLPTVTTVVLDSNGGWAREGRRIAEHIAARGLNTHVASECSSACTLAFLAGKVRSLRPGARLGFHNFSTGNGRPDEGPMREAYVRARMGSEFIGRIARTSPQQLWYPAPDELLRYRVLTHSPGKAMPDLGGLLTQL